MKKIFTVYFLIISAFATHLWAGRPVDTPADNSSQRNGSLRSVYMDSGDSADSLHSSIRNQYVANLLHANGQESFQNSFHFIMGHSREQVLSIWGRIRTEFSQLHSRQQNQIETYFNNLPRGYNPYALSLPTSATSHSEALRQARQRSQQENRERYSATIHQAPARAQRALF